MAHVHRNFFSSVSTGVRWKVRLHNTRRDATTPRLRGVRIFRIGRCKRAVHASDSVEGESKSSEKPTKDRSYRITVRGQEALRYTIPDFFPDFNYAGPPEPLDSQPIKQNEGEKAQTYYWKRSVIAGVEASTPRKKPVADDTEKGPINFSEQSDERPATLQRTRAGSDALNENSLGSRFLGALTVMLFVVAFLFGVASASRDLLPPEFVAPAIGF